MWDDINFLRARPFEFDHLRIFMSTPLFFGFLSVHRIEAGMPMNVY